MFVHFRASRPHTKSREEKMAKELQGKVAAVTGGASGIGLASAEAMLAAGACVVLVDRDEAALTALRERHGDAVIPLVIDLLDAKSCATLMSQILEKAGQLDILHANAGIYVGGDLVDANTDAIDRMLNLNVNVVMKNVHDVLPHMIERGTGDIVVTSSLAAHEELKFAVVAGAIAGGGLTVIANAPNPAGQSILQSQFDDGGINPLGL